MKLRKEFIAHVTDTEVILVPAGGVGWSGLIKGNKTLGTILELLKTETSEDAIIAAMVQRFDTSKEIIARDVKKAITELQKIGALDE